LLVMQGVTWSPGDHTLQYVPSSSTASYEAPVKAAWDGIGRLHSWSGEAAGMGSLSNPELKQVEALVERDLRIVVQELLKDNCALRRRLDSKDAAVTDLNEERAEQEAVLEQLRGQQRRRSTIRSTAFSHLTELEDEAADLHTQVVQKNAILEQQQKEIVEFRRRCGSESGPSTRDRFVQTGLGRTSHAVRLSDDVDVFDSPSRQILRLQEAVRKVMFVLRARKRSTFGSHVSGSRRCTRTSTLGSDRTVSPVRRLSCDSASPARAYTDLSCEHDLPRPSLGSELRLACLQGTANELQAAEELRQELAYRDDALTGLQVALRARWAAHEMWREEPLPCETAEQATRERTALEAAESQMAQSMQILVGAASSPNDSASYACEARNLVEEQLVMLQREYEARTVLQNREEPERHVEQPQAVPNVQEEQVSIASEHKQCEAKEVELLVTIKAMQKQISEVRQGFLELKQTEQRKVLEDETQCPDTDGSRDRSVQSPEQTKLDIGGSTSQKTEKGGDCRSKDCLVAAGAAADVSCIVASPPASTMVVAPTEHACRRCRPLGVQHAETPVIRTPRETRSPLSPGTGRINLWAPTSVMVGRQTPSLSSPCRPIARPILCASVTGTPREPQAIYAGSVHPCVSRSPSPPYHGITTSPLTPVKPQVRTLSCGSRTTPSVHIQAPPRNLARAVGALPMAHAYVSPPGSPGCWRQFHLASN